MNKIKYISNSIIILIFYFTTSNFISKLGLIKITNSYEEVLFLAFTQIFLFLIPTLYIIYTQNQDEVVDNIDNNNLNNQFVYQKNIKDKFHYTISFPLNQTTLIYILLGVFLLMIIQLSNQLTLEFAEKIIPKNYFSVLYEIYLNGKIQIEKLISTNNKIFILFTFAFLPAFVEETFFRGYFLNNLSKHFSLITSSIIVSLFFAALHFNPIFILQYFCISLVLNYIYIKSGSLFIVILIHFINNSIGIIYK